MLQMPRYFLIRVSGIFIRLPRRVGDAEGPLSSPDDKFAVLFGGEKRKFAAFTDSSSIGTTSICGNRLVIGMADGYAIHIDVNTTSEQAMSKPVALIIAVLLPLVAHAQTSPSSNLSALRSTARLEGSVEVRVVTRALANPVARSGRALTNQRRDVHWAQETILARLIVRGLVVGNHVSLQPDGSFTLRVLPAGLEQLAQDAEVQMLQGVTR